MLRTAESLSPTPERATTDKKSYNYREFCETFFPNDVIAALEYELEKLRMLNSIENRFLHRDCDDQEIPIYLSPDERKIVDHYLEYLKEKDPTSQKPMSRREQKFLNGYIPMVNERWLERTKAQLTAESLL